MSRISWPEVLRLYPECGKLDIIEERSKFKWEIPNFLSCTDESLSSPIFSFANDKWYLKVYPNGNIQDNLHKNGYLSVYLFRNSFGLPNKIDFTLGLQTIDGKNISMEHKECIFTDGNCKFGFTNYVLRSLLIDWSELSDMITIVCSLRLSESTKNTIAKIHKSPDLSKQNKQLEDFRLVPDISKRPT